MKDDGKFMKLSIKTSFSTGFITILSAFSHAELKTKATQTLGKLNHQKKNVMLQTTEKYSEIASLHKFCNFKKTRRKTAHHLAPVFT